MEEQEFERLFKVAFEKRLDQWLDKKFAQFGKYTARGLAVAAFGLFCWAWAKVYFNFNGG